MTLDVGDAPRYQCGKCQAATMRMIGQLEATAGAIALDGAAQRQMTEDEWSWHRGRADEIRQVARGLLAQWSTLYDKGVETEQQ